MTNHPDRFRNSPNKAVLPLHLTDGTVHEYVLVDAEDVERLSARRWRLDAKGTVIAADAPMSLATEALGVDAHTLVRQYNGDPLDCRKSNLFLVEEYEQRYHRFPSKRTIPSDQTFPSEPKPSSKSTVCSVDGCDAPAVSRELCQKHYARLRRHGDVEDRPRRRTRRPPSPCTADDCLESAAIKGLCKRHYYRRAKYGDLNLKPRSGPKPCSVDGCDNRAIAKTYCRKHYKRFYTYGDPLYGEK